MMKSIFSLGTFALVPLLIGCGSVSPARSGESGHLLIVGGGLDNDTRPVYERFLELAARHGSPSVLIATVATEAGYDEHSELIDKTEALRAWGPTVPVTAIMRETSTADTVAAIDRATAILFTGGDQRRITKRYRPAGKDTPEWLAMRRLLARGGVIAGCSAGDAMMGEIMLPGGDNAPALAAAKSESKGATSGPRIASGMGFLPWAVTDSHFFERDRMGRLVEALEVSGHRFGIGVGEDAAVEIDLARGEVIGLTVSDSLLIDVAALRRDGQARCQVRARLIRQGDRISLRELSSASPPPPVKPDSPVHVMPLAEPGQNRQLASWRVFMGARRPGSGVWEITFKGWRLTAWPDGRGEVVFDISPTRAPTVKAAF